MRDRDLPRNDYEVPWLLCNLGLVLARVIWGVSIPRAATIGTSRVARQLVPLVIGTCSSQSRGRAYQDPMASSPACKAAQGHHGVAEAHRQGVRDDALAVPGPAHRGASRSVAANGRKACTVVILESWQPHCSS